SRESRSGRCLRLLPIRAAARASLAQRIGSHESGCGERRCAARVSGRERQSGTADAAPGRAAIGHNRSVTESTERSGLARFVIPAVFVVSFFVFALLALRMRSLWDSDCYYHLAVARLYAQEGIAAIPPWGRFSLLSAGGDKEFLFH